MPWKVPITVDGLTYPVEFDGDSEPSESDINAAVQQILAQSGQPSKEVPGYLSQLGTALSIGGRQMTAGVKGTFNALTGDDADTAEAMAQMGALQREQEQAQTPQDIALTREFAKSKAAYDKAQGVWDTAEALSGYFGDVAEYPGAAFKQAVQSAPNAAIGTGTSIAGYALGGLLGAGAGAETGPGAILTGIAGAAAGGAVSNSLMEAGPAIYDVLNERTNGAAANMTAEQIAEVLRKDPTIASEGLKTGAIRGTVIGLVESLGMKGAGSILTIPERAAARAAQKTLMDAGVDVASKKAVEAAMKNVALRKSVSDAASTAKSQFTSAGNLARGAAATTIETASAGAGEVAAQAAIGQEIDPTAAVQEMIGEVGINAALTPAVKAAELAKRKPVTPAPDTDFARRAAMEGATELRDTTAGVPVVVEGITIATIPPGSDLSPDDVAAFVGMPDGPAVLKRYADQGRIVLPEIVKPVKNVDPALTEEMNQNIAAGAANASATVEELKKQEAQALYEVQTLAREWQAAEETLRQQEAERAAAEEQEAQRLAEEEQTAARETEERRKRYEAMRAEQSVKLELTPDESGATGAGMKEEIQQTPESATRPPRVGNVGAIPTPEEAARWEAVDAFTNPYVASLSGEDLDAFGAAVGAKRNGVGDEAYRAKILGNTHPDDLLDATPEAPAPQPITPTGEAPTDSLPADQPTSGDVGTSPAVQRDPSKPEQMTPGEAMKSGRDAELPKTFVKSDQFGNYITENKDGSFTLNKFNIGGYAVQGRTVDELEAATEHLADLSAESHREEIGRAVRDRLPVSAEAVDTYGIELPEGYVRQGELYVFQPTVTTANETPIDAANVDGGSQGVQSEPAEGSIPAVTEDTVSISDIPSTAENQTPPAPRSPAENLVSFTAANGQKLVGEVQSVTGNKATVAYQWNGKTKTQVVPVSQLGSPVASVATPPKYQYNQGQNTRKLGKHFPTALGVHANHDFRKSFASMAKDTSLGQDYRMIARMLSKMPEFKGMDLHLVADENIKYAGEYSWNNGKPSIAINLRLIARGQVDALGSILHEALHHVTLAKVRNPQGAFENEVVSKLDLIRESVREYAESKGFGERLDYELGSTEEFITALFTRPDFQALIASIPDSAAPGVAVGKFRSILSEIFRLIAELVHGKPVLRGSALEQAMTTSLALFNTPFRAIETGGLEALNAARSPGKGVKALFPQTGNKTVKPINLSAAYRKAATGKSSQWVSIKEVYEQAKADNPSLTPEAFMQFVRQQNDTGGVMISPVENVSTVEAAQPFVIGNAGVEMIVPSGTAASRIDEETDAEYLAAVEAGDMGKAQAMVDEAINNVIESLPASDNENDIPNTRSISSSLSDWEERGVREVPVEYLVDRTGEKFPSYMAGGIDRTIRLADRIENEGVTSPMILVWENEKYPYVLEGNTRYDALRVLASTGRQIPDTIPALVVVDKSADPVTRDESGNVIPLSQRFNPESPSTLYAAPIDTTQSNEPDAGTGGGRDSASSAQNGGASERAATIPSTEGGGNPASVLARLSAAREEAISAAVAESDWGNYTAEQKTEALNSFIRSVYGAADSSLRDAFRSVGGVLYTRGTRRSASATGTVGADGRLNLELTYDNSAGSENGVRGGASARDMFTHAYDTAQEEIIHAADKVAVFKRWEAAGRPSTFNDFEIAEGLQVLGQLNKARLDLQNTDPAAAQKIKDAMLASWGVYYGKPVEDIDGLVRHLEKRGNAALYFYELRRQLTQLKRQDFTTETGWQKFRNLIERWLTDAINALRGVQDVFRSGMAGDLIQRQLADLEAALDGKAMPPVSRPAASRADGGEGVIDIGGEAEPADGGGTQLFKKRETAIGSTYITPADITLQERRPQEETLAKARKIIAEEVQKDEKGGRAVALQRFKSDLSIPPEVRTAGTGLIAQQADLLANLERDAIKQEGLDALVDEAGKVSGIIGSDLEYWRNLQLAANLDIDKMAEEAGRTLNIFNVFRRLTPEGFLRRMKRQYNATVQESISQNFDSPPGEVEAEIMRLWRMMREAGATARGEAIAAALKAFMPRRVNTRRIIESLFPQAGTRQRMSKGGEALVRKFFQMMAGPRDQKGPLAEFDESIQNALSGMLRKVMESNGLVAKNQSNQATDIDKLVRSVSADELRFDKIAAADEAMQKELDAIEDPERRSTLRQAWEEATAKMYTNVASDATVRRAINSELKGMNVDWRKMFDSNQKPDAIKAKVVDAVMTKIEGLLTDAADPTVRQNLNMLRGEVEAAFDFIAANKRTEWLAYREGIEARRRVAEHRAAFMEALRNQGVAEDALLRISKKLLAGPLPQKPDQNPVSALVGEHMKEEVPNLVDKLVALDVDRATAEQLDTAAKALRADIAEAEKLKAAERAVKKLMDSLKPKPRAPREKIEKALKALFTAAETGALDSQEFFDALGEALGHPPLTAEQQAKIKKLTREINALPKGAARVDKQQELDEELALWKGIAARDVLLSAWYANILSGISTQGMGLQGNSLNMALRSFFLAITNPRSAKAYFQGVFGEGLETGLREAKAAMKGRGLYKVSKYGDKNLIGMLELLRKKGPATLPEWIAYIASGGTRLRYVFRIMQAIDALAWNTAREGQAYLAAHRALLDQQRAGANRSPEEFYRAFVESLGGDAKQIGEDMRTAREELISRGQTPDLTTIARMAGEARNARRSSTVNKMSNRFADRIVMQQDPEGSGRVIHRLINVIQREVEALGIPFGQLLVPFNKIVSNLFEQSLDYTPVGALRSYLGGHLTDIQSIDWSGKVQFKDKSVQFDAVERAERTAASVTGTLAASVMFALASLFKDEPDEDVPFMIYGFGPESKNKRDQMPKGWTPYSMKVGDAYIKFSEMPFGFMFAAAGNALDAMRYKNMDNKSSAERLAYVLKTSAKGFTEQGVLSSFDTALEVLTFQASDKKFTDVPVNVAKGMVPGQGMLRDISVMFDPVKVKDDTIAAAFLRDFPVVRRIGTRPALNVFGEPMTFDGRIPFVRRIATVREKHPVADYLGRNGLSIPGMAQTIVVGQYLPKDMKDRIQRRALQTSAMENGVFTVEQDYNFRKRAGELTKAAVEGLLTQVPTITSDRQRENVQNLINRKVEIARRRAMLEAVPAQ